MHDLDRPHLAPLARLLVRPRRRRRHADRVDLWRRAGLERFADRRPREEVLEVGRRAADGEEEDRLELVRVGAVRVLARLLVGLGARLERAHTLEVPELVVLADELEDGRRQAGGDVDGVARHCCRGREESVAVARKSEGEEGRERRERGHTEGELGVLGVE